MKNELTPPIMESLLNRRINTYDLRYFHEIATDRKGTAWYGLETLSYRYPKLCSLLPQTRKEIKFLHQFKRLTNGFAITVRAGHVNLTFKILEFYNAAV